MGWKDSSPAQEAPSDWASGEGLEAPGMCSAS